MKLTIFFHFSSAGPAMALRRPLVALRVAAAELRNCAPGLSTAEAAEALLLAEDICAALRPLAFSGCGGLCAAGEAGEASATGGASRWCAPSTEAAAGILPDLPEPLICKVLASLPLGSVAAAARTCRALACAAREPAAFERVRLCAGGLRVAHTYYTTLLLCYCLSTTSYNLFPVRLARQLVESGSCTLCPAAPRAPPELHRG